MPTNNQATIISSESRSFSARLSGPLFWILLMIILVATFLVFYFTFWTVWKSTSSGEGSLSSFGLQSSINDAQQRLVALQQHEAQLQGLAQTDLDRMAIALPTGAEYPEFLVQLEALQRDTGMLDGQFTAPPPSDAPAAPASTDANGTVTPLTLTGSFDFTVSSYEHLKNIVDTLQKNLRLFDINSLTFEASTEHAVINFTTYYMR